MENQIIGPILPLRDLVVYPSITSPLFVGRAKSIDAINFAMNNNEKIIYLFTQKEPTSAYRPVPLYTKQLIDYNIVDM